MKRNMHKDKVVLQFDGLTNLASQILDKKFEEDWDLTILVPKSYVAFKAVQEAEVVISLLTALTDARIHKLQLGSFDTKEQFALILESRIYDEEA